MSKPRKKAKQLVFWRQETRSHATGLRQLPRLQVVGWRSPRTAGGAGRKARDHRPGDGRTLGSQAAGTG